MVTEVDMTQPKRETAEIHPISETRKIAMIVAGTILCLAGLLGSYFRVDDSGWIIFIGALMFLWY